MANWKIDSLSFAARATLVQTVTSTIPFYVMQRVKIPEATLKEIDRCNRRFLWGEKDGERKVHYVAWDQVCLPKECGGLGIRNLSLLNEAALSKLGWNLLKHEDGLWQQILYSKYGSNAFSCKSNASHLWRGIWSTAAILDEGVCWRVGNGKSIHFWLDTWLTDSPLASIVPEIPEEHLSPKVIDYWNGNDWHWFDLQPVLPREFLNLLRAQVLITEDANYDVMSWKFSDTGGFSVKGTYESLVGVDVYAADTRKWKKLWKCHGPARWNYLLSPWSSFN